MTAHIMNVYSMETVCIQYTASKYSHDPLSLVHGTTLLGYPQ
jgi:hypothetical protein